MIMIPKSLRRFLENSFDLTEVEVVDFGLKYYKLYSALKKFSIFYGIHKVILIKLLENKNNTAFQLVGLDIEMSALLIEDINDTFQSLNELTSDEEFKLPKLILSEGANSIPIYVEEENEEGISLLYSKQAETAPPDKVLTDRRIYYQKTGKVVNEEIDDNGINKQVQRFYYDSKRQENALKYFLNNIFRKSSFKPGQEAIINLALRGKDVIGLLPTGGGKSLTFQLCALLQPGVTIVVDPINSLMKDQYDKLLDNGITRTTFINSFDTKEERIQKTYNLVEGQYQIVFISPERLQMDAFRSALLNCWDNGIFFSYGVIDEAHCVSEWGHDFRPVYLNLSDNLHNYCVTKEDDLTLFGLTATASFDVLADVQRVLGLKEDAIINLPAEAIDRKELNFQVIPIRKDITNGISYSVREKQLGESKYPEIVKFLKSIPLKNSDLFHAIGETSPADRFFNEKDGNFLQAGVIFCPTKSDKLPNGVISLSNFLSKQPDLNLELTTFFGGQGDDTVKEAKIEKLASESLSNQVKFIENKANLMIATKAFGMGIDKPNIRYTLHYLFPGSIESFYQEAGRAGRDGLPAVCSILFHPRDIETNYDFYQNGFKGIKREREIITELLEEVRYEDGFFFNVIKGIVKEEYPEVHGMSLFVDTYIYLNGEWKEDPAERITIGRLRLDSLSDDPKSIKNFPEDRSNEILDFLRSILREKCPNGNYKQWLATKAADGIKKQIENADGEELSLMIGFTNRAIRDINEEIISAGYDDFNERIIRAAYNFSGSADAFLNNLAYQYYKYQISEYGDNIRDFRTR
jgi:ATP-dependent DNA helicase RecQ